MHDPMPPADTAIQTRLCETRSSTSFEGSSNFACTRDPDRWTTTPDEGAKALCRACPRRWLCAQEACRIPGAEGLWAGIFIPEAGRGRQFALRQLRSLAESNGYPVRRAAS